MKFCSEKLLEEKSFYLSICNPKSKSARKGAETQSWRKVFFFCFSLRNLSGFASRRECF